MQLATAALQMHVPASNKLWQQSGAHAQLAITHKHKHRRINLVAECRNIFLL